MNLEKSVDYSRKSLETEQRQTGIVEDLSETGIDREHNVSAEKRLFLWCVYEKQI